MTKKIVVVASMIRYNNCFISSLKVSLKAFINGKDVLALPLPGAH